MYNKLTVLLEYYRLLQTGLQLLAIQNDPKNCFL